MYKFILCALFLAFGFQTPTTFALTVFHNKSTSGNDDLNIALLTLVLNKADPTIKILSSEEPYTDDRASAELERGKLSVIWTMTSKDKEKQMLPVRYCLFKGLLGYRIFIINSEDQHKFNNINFLGDLTVLKAGQGATWTDTLILRNAGIPVITTTKYKNLFPMLDGGRFDYFPRGVFEPWSEIEAWPQYSFVVEQKLLIQYPAAMYFFVRKDNTELAETLSRGFELAIADGSYDQLFYSSKPVVQALSKSNLTKRKIIRLDNPYLSSETPIHRKELWFDMDKAMRIVSQQKNLSENWMSGQ